MNLTSAARKNFVAEMVAFENAANEMLYRFYNFLIAHDPKGHAEYQLFPFPDSTVPLWVGYFNLVPYEPDALSDDLFAAAASNSLYFRGPLSESEIAVKRQAEELFRGAGGESEDSPHIYETQNVWNTQDLFIHVPDAYLDDPDGWEASVLAAMTADRDAA